VSRNCLCRRDFLCGPPSAMRSRHPLEIGGMVHPPQGGCVTDDEVEGLEQQAEELASRGDWGPEAEQVNRRLIEVDPSRAVAYTSSPSNGSSICRPAKTSWNHQISTHARCLTMPSNVVFDGTSRARSVSSGSSFDLPQDRCAIPVEILRQELALRTGPVGILNLGHRSPPS
jgi:hypothetical protein